MFAPMRIQCLQQHHALEVDELRAGYGFHFFVVQAGGGFLHQLFQVCVVHAGGFVQRGLNAHFQRPFIAQGAL